MCSESENPDLFWALRGGGGNFGVATSFEYQLHPVGPLIFGGIIGWALSQAAEILAFHREQTRSAPDELGLSAVFVTAPPLHGHAVDPGRPRSTGTSLALEGGLSRRAHRRRDRRGRRGRGAGAVARVGADDTAFGQRDGRFLFNAVSMWEDPSANDANVAWARAFHEALQPFATEGVYVNVLSDEGPERVAAAYGPEKFERLARIKAEYDPDNRFRLNQNIPPAK